ncbi:LOW QUALITY PROTEIN: C-Jun-amino-terminal kinase-interacting protein 4-like [Ptychodera flava]|uniref:LOW QUALITY PROTEIN: C-Jun-amino-terminal kinase-interacting protein 4-like n=1 Tax=Ptychodera flava TaxID=63121 RepID=UPI00396A77B6
MMDDGLETVYGTGDDGAGGVMSERVSALASNIYREFERMIRKYDEDVVKELMPLVVNVLENLDGAYSDNQENDVELELLRDDNEQLITQYEREKQLRKHTEQKLFEVEDASEQYNQELQNKNEELSHEKRQLELKVRNYSDQVSRLEERENDMKKEYITLQTRHTEMMKTYMEHIEKTKLLGHTDTVGSPRLFKLNIPHPLRPVSPIHDGHVATTPTKDSNLIESYDMTTPSAEKESKSNDESLLQEMQMPVDSEIRDNLDRKVDKDTGSKSIETQATVDTSSAATVTTPMNEYSGMSKEAADILASTPELTQITSPESNEPEKPRSAKEMRGGHDSILSELALQDPDVVGDLDDGADITDPGEYSVEFLEEPNDFQLCMGSLNPSSQFVHEIDSESDDSNLASFVTPTSDNFFGMGKEVENLILENSELRATKHALNIVKDDLIAKVDELSGEMDIMKEEIGSLQTVKGRLNLRITELEEELKKAKEENEKIKMVEEDDDVPMAQRKRFTRVEMARVLMERNQYKERLMELQEAVRWTEMIRASREHPSLETKKNKSSIWKFFSNLFSSSNAPSKKPYPPVNVKYNAPTSHVTPASKKRSGAIQSLGDKSKAFEFLEADGESAQRMKDKREQYRKVKAHVKKDDGRVQAYGWSLPAKVPSSVSKPNVTQTDSSRVWWVPVPVYCRPLLEQEPGMKIWCAAGVNLTGGKTRDGGSIVGASVFYSDTEEKDESTEKDNSKPQGDLEKLEKEIKDHQKEQEGLSKQNLSSLAWICTSTHSTSKVTVIDANQPQNVLDSFPACNSHVLCIASVPGATESDYPAGDDILNLENTEDSAVNESGLGHITVVAASATSSDATPRTASPVSSDKGDLPSPNKGDYKADVSAANIAGTKVASVSDAMEALTEAATAPPSQDTIGMEGMINEESITGEDSGETREQGSGFSDPLGATFGKQRETSGDLHKDGVSALPTENDFMYVEVEKMSSVLPTMWLGAQNGCLYVHSAVAQWKRCLHSIKLKDSILAIVHVKGRVLVALADGNIAIFHRAEDGQWDLRNYHLLDLGRPHHSIRCMVVVGDKVWCGYRNKIHVIQPQTMKIEKSFDAHPRKESQVRQLAWVGDGVWVSIRLDSTLRLYHAHTYQHLQDVDIEPYVSKMLGTGKLGFSFVRITALMVSSNRLWVGTGNGVIISIPLTEATKPTLAGSAGSRPGGVIRVYADSKTDSVTPGSFIPYCSMAQAQLSFHGHRDAVKFFVAVPELLPLWNATTGGVSTATGSSSDTAASQTPSDKLSTKNMLVLSGGEGYIDFRIGDGDDEDDSGSSYGDIQMTTTKIARSERSHLIVWQITGVAS